MECVGIGQTFDYKLVEVVLEHPAKILMSFQENHLTDNVSNDLYQITQNLIKLELALEVKGNQSDKKLLLKTINQQLNNYPFKDTKEFKMVLHKLNQISKKAAAEEHATSTIVHIEPEQLIDEPTEITGLLQDHLDQEIDLNANLIEQRDIELLDLQKSILEVNQIFTDLNCIVNDQQYLLDNIESNVQTVTGNLEGAVGELAQGSRYQANASKKYWYCFVILLIMVVVVILSMKPWKWFA